MAYLCHRKRSRHRESGEERCLILDSNPVLSSYKLSNLVQFFYADSPLLWNGKAGELASECCLKSKGDKVGVPLSADERAKYLLLPVSLVLWFPHYWKVNRRIVPWPGNITGGLRWWSKVSQVWGLGSVPTLWLGSTQAHLTWANSMTCTPHKEQRDSQRWKQLPATLYRK